MTKKMTVYQYKYHDFAEALYDALIPDPFYMTLENSIPGSPATKREAMLRYLDYSMIEGETYGKLHIPTEHKYGVSVWSEPIAQEMELKKKSNKIQFLLNHLGQTAVDTYLSITEFMSQNSIKLVSSKPWYLSIVGLKPSYQNKGLGAGLLEPILVESDRQRIATYLETFTPRNIKFYQRLGYKSIDSIHEPTTNSPYWVMLREPK